MPKLANPTSIVKRWSASSSKKANYVSGIQDTTENPMDKAAAASETWQQRVSSPEALNKFRTRLTGRNINDWKQPAMDKGAANWVTGMQKGEKKYGDFLTDAAPFMLQLQQQVRAMPNATEEDKEARQLAWSRGMKKYRRMR